MTYEELIKLLLSLSDVERAETAGVWPPESCPASSFVRVTGMSKTSDGKPVIVTGKSPEEEV